MPLLSFALRPPVFRLKFEATPFCLFPFAMSLHTLDDFLTQVVFFIHFFSGLEYIYQTFFERYSLRKLEVPSAEDRHNEHSLSLFCGTS